eukprot:NODE_917_length_1236_cov_262.625105_g685_i0.p1 GENE.NODE_917_length_1236_cov_262.625105_g685_i0~~NODE_917_length_1236_cov_262.625105_g685_i0.p1  ORF type:complete len:292 (-),score=34.62 NODE_917_length_1236_cov_262.625105_g685_i0:267-1142(-)
MHPGSPMKSVMKRLSAATSKDKAAHDLVNDPDIRAEQHSLEDAKKQNNRLPPPTPVAVVEGPTEIIPLNWQPNAGGHKPNSQTRRMLKEIGGIAGLERATTLFYQRAFADPHLEKFLRSDADPHGARFAAWVAEKFGDETLPWTRERATRKVCPFQSHGHQLMTPHDRSSAHHAAWHSPKREPNRFGQHFKLDDSRVWMRLHFWAFRETGLFSHTAFMEYYVKFIGHFISIYERTAPPFARESARWSADSARIQRYVRAGNVMDDVIGVPLAQASRDLAPAESRGSWPYGH